MGGWPLKQVGNGRNVGRQNRRKELDPLLSSLLKRHVDVLFPILARIINASLSSVVVPQSMKHAVVTPILKTRKADLNVLTTTAPIRYIVCGFVPGQLQRFLDVIGVDVPSETWEGEGALMRCTTTATTFTRVYWYKGSESNIVYVHATGRKDGTKLHDFSNRIVVGRLVGNGHELYINKTFLTDEDTYICKIGSAVNSAKLAVNVKPEGVSVTGLDRAVKQNTQVTVTCDVRRVKPKADIYWRKGTGGSLQTGTPTNQPPNTDGTFHLRATYKVSFNRNEHNTQLYCLITQPGHRDVVWGMTHKTISVNYPPSTAVTQTSTGKPTEGSSVTLTCVVTVGRPSDYNKPVTWKKGNTVISSDRYKISDNDLIISSLDRYLDDGHYSCAAENDAGFGDFSAIFQLLVNYKPTVSVMTPAPAVEGQSVTITCRSQGARPAVNNVTWTKGQEVIRVTTDTKYTAGTVQTPSLTIKQTTKTDAGEYICQLNNNVGQDTGTVTLQIWYKPYGQATTDQTSVSVAIAGQVSLTCHAPTEPGNPAASWFIWHKQNSDFSKNTTGVLSLTPSGVDESGKFSCVAGNWVGQSDNSDWETVTVQEPPETPTHVIVLNNSISVALTLQWQPGLSGSHPPQTGRLLKTRLEEHRKDVDNTKKEKYTRSGKKRLMSTINKSALTDHVTTENHIIDWEGVSIVDKEPNRRIRHIKEVIWIRKTTTPINRDEGNYELPHVYDDVIKRHRQSSRRKRSTSTVVSVVIHYQRDGGEEGHYPPEGSVDGKQQSAVVSGEFDTEATYKVWLKVFEGQLTFPSKILQPLEATAARKKDVVEHSCSTVTVIAAVLGSLLLVFVLGLLVLGFIWRRRQQSNCTEDAVHARDATKLQMEMSDATRSSSADAINDTKQYQTLRDRATEDTSNHRGTYASLDEPEATQQPVPGRTYENVDTISQPKHTYVNTPVMRGDNAEYAEVT
ncbi:hypothetical protein LSAT2_028453 [Lamellibrachia satsuma]|nr:hypothetical protein LSAT2_028453 [Lamellibrachia satsuma]